MAEHRACRRLEVLFLHKHIRSCGGGSALSVLFMGICHPSKAQQVAFLGAQDILAHSFRSGRYLLLCKPVSSVGFRAHVLRVLFPFC